MTITRQKALVAPLTMFALCAVSGFAKAPSLGLQAYIPVACSVAFSGASAQFDSEGRAKLGRTSETCNSGAGYRIFARASGDVAGTSLSVDGREVALVPGREVLLVDEVGAGSIAREIVYNAQSMSDGGSLELRMEAK